jgi:hypothetical protein
MKLFFPSPFTRKTLSSYPTFPLHDHAFPFNLQKDDLKIFYYSGGGSSEKNAKQIALK